jgi:restriction system protein
MRRSYVSSINRLVRELERSQKANARAAAQAARQQERERREMVRADIAERKEQHRQYLEDRASEVREDNEALDRSVQELKTLLQDGLDEKRYPTFEQLVKKPVAVLLKLDGVPPEQPKPELSSFLPKAPGFLFGWIPFVRSAHEKRIEQAQKRFAGAGLDWEASNDLRQRVLNKAKDDHAKAVREAQKSADEHNDNLRLVEEAVRAGESEVVEEYFDNVLETAAYPDGFDLPRKVAYSKESHQLVVEIDFPAISAVIPLIEAYQYVKTSDSIKEKLRSEKDKKALYTSVVAQAALRSLHRIFSSDHVEIVETVVLNGVVETINPATGRLVRVCLVSLRTTRDVFEAVDLRHVDPVAALHTFNAAFSRNPAELTPVRPILEFNMVDPRFIQEGQVLSKLDDRTNLMDLTPGEFESLITNLFSKMGLETRQTQASRDGGVDCVAYDPRPIFGGKVVIQAKRYKDTVGVSAVRDLFGTMQNEGASKGILVATSGYGKAAFEFAAGKPLELLDGANLLSLLQEHAGLDARIVMPAEKG